MFLENKDTGIKLDKLTEEELNNYISENIIDVSEELHKFTEEMNNIIQAAMRMEHDALINENEELLQEGVRDAINKIWKKFKKFVKKAFRKLRELPSKITRKLSRIEKKMDKLEKVVKENPKIMVHEPIRSKKGLKLLKDIYEGSGDSFSSYTDESTITGQSIEEGSKERLNQKYTQLLALKEMTGNSIKLWAAADEYKGHGKSKIKIISASKAMEIIREVYSYVDKAESGGIDLDGVGNAIDNYQDKIDRLEKEKENLEKGDNDTDEEKMRILHLKIKIIKTSIGIIKNRIRIGNKVAITVASDATRIRKEIKEKIEDK